MDFKTGRPFVRSRPESSGNFKLNYGLDKHTNAGLIDHQSTTLISSLPVELVLYPAFDLRKALFRKHCGERPQPGASPRKSVELQWEVLAVWSMKYVVRNLYPLFASQRLLFNHIYMIYNNIYIYINNMM